MILFSLNPCSSSCTCYSQRWGLWVGRGTGLELILAIRRLFFCALTRLITSVISSECLQTD